MRQAGASYRVARSHQRFEFSPDAEPALRVPSGARVTFETLDCFSGKVTSPDQRYAAEADLLDLVGAYNPVAGPVYVDGARPGDVLAVAVEEIALGTAAPFAVTMTFGSGSAYVTAACPGLPAGGDTRICPIVTGPAGPEVIFPAAGGGLRLPARPMVGTIGTAPAAGPVPSLVYGAGHGGNVDCPLVTTGSVLYLPVNVPGALLSLGDVHAGMGDAEITGTALETSGDVAVTVTVLPGAGRRRPALPHLDTADLLGVVGCQAGAGVQANIEAAMLELHTRLTGDYGLSAADAYQLLGASARVLVNQCVAPPAWAAVHVGVPRAILAAAPSSPVPGTPRPA